MERKFCFLARHAFIHIFIIAFTFHFFVLISLTNLYIVANLLKKKGGGGKN